MTIEVTISSDEFVLNPCVLLLCLPKGCGLAFAEDTIEKAQKQLKAVALEMHKAYTEGREIVMEKLIDQSIKNP